MKVCCVFSSESPHQGDSNEYTQHTCIASHLTIYYAKYISYMSHRISNIEYDISTILY